MAEVSFTANTKAGSRIVKIDFDFGANLDDAVQKFGEEAVFANYVRQAKVGIQAAGRGLAGQLTESGEFANSDEQIVEKLNSWQPSDGTVQRIDKSAKLEKLLEGMSQEEREAFFAKYMG